ncbi:hypothetical protein [Streptomyces sp. NPDC091040]|uniref:hypothetical protein n=1 Tax=Streptomyces sp. NPDC091040 TaxID=3365972 RepID=UPI0037F76F44
MHRLRGPARGTGPPLSRSEAERFAAQVEQALYASKVIASDQGFTMIRDAAATCDRDVNLGAVAGIWRAGCIIRAAFLGRIRGANGCLIHQLGTPRPEPAPGKAPWNVSGLYPVLRHDC